MLRTQKLRTLTTKKIPAAGTGARFLSGAMGALLGLVLVAASADAQEGGPSSEVTVSQPLGFQRGPAGLAPIVVVAQSRLVHYEDLDLRTEDGAETLRSRIYAAARSICDRLNMQYPATYQGWGIRSPVDPNCYRGAINSALPGAEAAIRAAQSGYGGH